MTKKLDLAGGRAAALKYAAGAKDRRVSEVQIEKDLRAARLWAKKNKPVPCTPGIAEGALGGALDFKARPNPKTKRNR